MHLFDAAKISRLDDPQRLQSIPLQKIAERLDLKPGMELADIGSGSGLFTFGLSEYLQPGGKAVGFDIQQLCIDHSMRKLEQAPASAVTFIKSSPSKIPGEDASFHAVTMIMLAHEVSEPESFYKEIKRIMKPGAKLAIVDWHAKQTKSGPPPEDRISPEALSEQLKGYGFSVLTLEDINADNYLLTAVLD